MFGDNWRKLPRGYWDAMAKRCAGLPFNELLKQAVLSRSSVIEIGCGAGHLAASFVAAGYRGAYWACDISPAAAAAARGQMPSWFVVDTGRFEELSDAGRVPQAEIVIARSVIQHQEHWLPLVQAALRHAPCVVLGVSRSIYFKETGEHEVSNRGHFYDVRISLEAMQLEATEAGLDVDFARLEGERGPEVVITITRAD